MRPTPYVASLRVYEPITDFKPEQQAQWRDLSSAEDTKTEEQTQALRRAMPTATAAEIERLVNRWLAERPGAQSGDGPSPPLS